MSRRSLLLILILLPFLKACSSGSGTSIPSPPSTASAREGIVAIERIHAAVSRQAHKPSAMLGIFTAAYIAQGIFTPTTTAAQGINATQKILQGQNVPTTSETFALLQQLGTVLQVDIVDALNRSGNRREALDAYIESLKGIGGIALRKQKELELQVEERTNERKAQNAIVRETDRTLRDALRDEDYTAAAEKQETLAEAQSKLAAIEAKLEQTEDILGRLEDLLEIAQERLTAMQNNREVLIAGLRVIEVPGIEDLGILNESTFYRKARGGRENAPEDVFGTDIFQKE